MIRADPQTEADLREAVRLATFYAGAAYRAEGVTEFGKIPREQFVARCHEGFDLAQKLILKNLLSLETKLKALRAEIAQRSKGKKKKEIARDEKVVQLRRDENEAAAIADAFRRVADTMVWQILGMNKVLMRSTHTSHGSRGYLSDTNVASLVDARAGPGCLNNNSASISGASAGVRPPRGAEEDRSRLDPGYGRQDSNAVVARCKNRDTDQSSFVPRRRFRRLADRPPRI
jgi:hypothetical protein